MNKKTITTFGALAVLLGAAGCGYWYYLKPEAASPVEQAGSAVKNLSEQASQGVLPTIDPGSNPMEDAPDVNPVSKTNPFSDIKTNPFN